MRRLKVESPSHSALNSRPSDTGADSRQSCFKLRVSMHVVHHRMKRGALYVLSGLLQKLINTHSQSIRLVQLNIPIKGKVEEEQGKAGRREKGEGKEGQKMKQKFVESRRQ